MSASTFLRFCSATSLTDSKRDFIPFMRAIKSCRCLIRIAVFSLGSVGMVVVMAVS